MRNDDRIASARHKRGFSIAEMLVVITIIAFATTVSLLAYSNYRKGSGVRNASSEVSRVLTTAQMRAIAQNKPSSVVFDLDNQGFWVDDLDDGLAVRIPKVVPVKSLSEDVVIDTLRIGANEFTTGMQRIIFWPDGTNPLITVNIRNQFDDSSVDENFYSVQMYPTSAKPKIWPHERK